MNQPRIERIRQAKVLALAMGVVSLTFGCKGKNHPLRADLRGAKRLGISSAVGPTAFASSQPGDMLMKIDSAGNATPVFNQNVITFGIVFTPTHLVAVGQYMGIADTSGHTLDCYLVSVPLTASNETVKCLSQAQIGTVAPGAQGNPAYDQLGVAARNSTVFFTSPYWYGKSEFRRWQSGSDVTELLIQLDATATDGQIQDVVVSNSAGNVCVITQGNPGKFICGDAAGTNWTALSGLAFTGYWFPLVRKIVLYNQTVDLADLSVTPHTTDADLPLLRANRVVLSDGSGVGISSSGFLVGVATNGDLSIIDQSEPWERMLHTTDDAWIYGGSELRRFSLSTKTLDPTNYLGSTQLLQVTAMSYTSTGGIRLDGTGSSGAPTIVYISTNGTITTSTEDLPRFDSVVPLP